MCVSPSMFLRRNRHLHAWVSIADKWRVVNGVKLPDIENIFTEFRKQWFSVHRVATALKNNMCVPALSA